MVPVEEDYDVPALINALTILIGILINKVWVIPWLTCSALNNIYLRSIYFGESYTHIYNSHVGF